MLEFILKEVYSVEKSETSRGSLLRFFLDGHREDIVVLQNEGIFEQYITYENLLYNLPVGGQSIKVGKNIFTEAQNFYDINENRKLFLPIVDEKGQLISFMCWNNQAMGEENPTQDLELIEQAERLYISECNELIYVWLLNFLKKHSGKEINRLSDSHQIG